MNTNFLKSEDFRMRLITGVVVGFLLVLSFFTPDAFLFRVLFMIAGIMAFLELALTARDRICRGLLVDDNVITVEVIAIIVGTGAVALSLTPKEIIIAILAAVLNDTCAYFTGNFLHDKFFRTRPFPRTSPKKSWEGIIGGYAGAIIGVYILMRILGLFSLRFLIAAPLFAIIGDLIESMTKRCLDVKDSGDVILRKQIPGLKDLELAMRGHGGYADRIDSWVFTVSLMFLLKAIIQL